MTFSIITATHNVSSVLHCLLESLATQTFRDFQLIIQDGASTDSTLDIIESYRSRLPKVLVESASDRGIYDAWNKALDRAGETLGQWVLFLGGDDKLADPFVLERVANKIRSVSDNVDYFSCDLIKTSSACAQELPLVLAENPVKTLRFGMPCGHPALFHRGRLFTTNRFSTQYRIAGDYDFLIRTLKKDSQIVRYAICAVYMADGGISSSPISRNLLMQENQKILKKYFYLSHLFHIFYLHLKAKIQLLCRRTFITRNLWHLAKKIKNLFS